MVGKKRNPNSPPLKVGKTCDMAFASIANVSWNSLNMAIREKE